MADSTTPTTEDIKVEDVSSEEEDVPGLEPAHAGAAGAKAKQSRSEKKARKVVQRLGLKPVPGVLRVRVKKGKNVRISTVLSKTRSFD